MSSSSSSPKNTTTTTDQRTTQTLNAGLGGDVEGMTAAGNYGDTTLTSMTEQNDNSFRADIRDDSDHSIDFEDSSTKTSNLADYSDNSFSANLLDLSGSSNSGNSSTTTHTTTNITDGGAFAVVNNLVAKVFDSNKSLIDLVGMNSKAAMQGANDLAARGIDGAMNIKAGEAISESDNKAMATTALKIVAVGGLAYVAAKAIKR